MFKDFQLRRARPFPLCPSVFLQFLSNSYDLPSPPSYTISTGPHGDGDGANESREVKVRLGKGGHHHHGNDVKVRRIAGTSTVRLFQQSESIRISSVSSRATNV